MLSKKFGFSIVELMIAMLIALIIISAVMKIYVSTIKNSRNLLSSSSLSQELTAVMNILVHDIRRSGFYSGVKNNQLLSDNPFYGVREVLPQTNPASYYMPYAIHINKTQNCISLAYDANQDTGLEVQKNDIFAFRLKNNAIQTLQRVKLANFAKKGCANNSGSWMNISDSGLIKISELTFSTLSSQCYHLNSGKQWQINSNSSLFPCLSPNNQNPVLQTGDRLVEIRMVNILIKAHLAADLKLQKQISQLVRVRNDVAIIIP